ncbi:MAG: ABC transporter permease [Firmicutes bacterium]|jgi:cell division transport system permease protein|nr:ABC transporter permease [Bacillota bacterium]
MGLSAEYVAKETFTNLWRNRLMALAAVLTVAVSLSLVGTALLLRQAVNRQIGAVANNVNLQIFVNPGAANSELTYIRQEIKATPQIESCTYLNSEASYNQAKQLLKGQKTVLSVLSPATVPTDFRCQLHNPNQAATVGALFSAGIPGIYKVTWPGQSIHVMEQVTGVLQLILLIVAIALMVSSLVLILNAIRMAIFARRREVSVMKLVGATNWFIRIPFMAEGLVQGLLGSLVAVGIVLLSNWGLSYLSDRVQALAQATVPSGDLIVTEIIVVLIGLVVGVAGSSAAVRRFLDV